MRSLVKDLIHRLSNPISSQETALGLLALGYHAFDVLGDAEHSAKPLWHWACDDSSYRALDVLEEHWYRREHSTTLPLLVTMWVDDAWGIQVAPWVERPEMAQRLLGLAIASLQHVDHPSAWSPSPNLTKRYPCLMTSDNDRFGSWWDGFVGRFLVQRLMQTVQSLTDHGAALAFLGACENLGVPSSSWMADWQMIQPEHPSLGLGTWRGSFLSHLCRFQRWDVVSWMVKRLPNPWEAFSLPRSNGTTYESDVLSEAWLDLVTPSDGMGHSIFTESPGAVAALLLAGIEAARQGDRLVRARLDQPLFEVRNLTAKQHQTPNVQTVCSALQAYRTDTLCLAAQTSSLPHRSRSRL